MFEKILNVILPIVLLVSCSVSRQTNSSETVNVSGCYQNAEKRVLYLSAGGTYKLYRGPMFIDVMDAQFADSKILSQGKWSQVGPCIELTSDEYKDVMTHPCEYSLSGEDSSQKTLIFRRAESADRLNLTFNISYGSSEVETCDSVIVLSNTSDVIRLSLKVSPYDDEPSIRRCPVYYDLGKLSFGACGVAVVDLSWLTPEYVCLEHYNHDLLLIRHKSLYWHGIYWKKIDDRRRLK